MDWIQSLKFTITHYKSIQSTFTNISFQNEKTIEIEPQENIEFYQFN